jgi:hypothetical protein
MKNSKIILILLFWGGLPLSLLAQEDVMQYLSEAKSSYGAGNLQDARFSIQQSLQALDVIIGKEILKIMPLEMNPFVCNETEDNVVGNIAGITGLSVSRNYYDKSDSLKYLNIMINNNSPMLASLNAMMTNPLLMNSADGSQKVTRVSGYKGVLTKRTDNDKHSGYDLQISINQTLVTYNCEGITREADMIALAEKLDLKAIASLAGGN